MKCVHIVFRCNETLFTICSQTPWLENHSQSMCNQTHWTAYTFSICLETFSHPINFNYIIYIIYANLVVIHIYWPFLISMEKWVEEPPPPPPQRNVSDLPRKLSTCGYMYAYKINICFCANERKRDISNVICLLQKIKWPIQTVILWYLFSSF